VLDWGIYVGIKNRPGGLFFASTLMQVDYFFFLAAVFFFAVAGFFAFATTFFFAAGFFAEAFFAAGFFAVAIVLHDK
jgi:hypothetical protein